MWRRVTHYSSTDAPLVCVVPMVVTWCAVERWLPDVLNRRMALGETWQPKATINQRVKWRQCAIMFDPHATHTHTVTHTHTTPHTLPHVGYRCCWTRYAHCRALDGGCCGCYPHTVCYIAVYPTFDLLRLLCVYHAFVTFTRNRMIHCHPHPRWDG